MIDDRAYLLEALFERLADDGFEHRVLVDALGEAEIVVPHALLADMPRAVARFGQEFDLRLVQLARPQYRAWRFVLAWSDELGQPRFITATVCSDWYRGTRRLLRADELLRGAPHTLFLHALLDAVERQALPAERATRLASLWDEDPHACARGLERFWRGPHARLLAHAARQDEWAAVLAVLPALRRALRWTRRPVLDAALERLGTLVRRTLEPAGMVIAFVGEESEARRSAMQAVARDLAGALPGGVRTVAYSFRDDDHAGADLRVIFDDAELAAQFQDAVAVDTAQPLAASVAEIERVALRWMECRVERRHPDALVGDNPPAARLLQLACTHEVPLLAGLLRTLLNSDIDCRIRSPILMPHPYGIVIERGVAIGSRVTIMQQATLGARRPGERGVPVIEDNVVIGPGAKVLGAVRIGRGATIGANAVVTRDVPSHCTVVGANRVLGRERRSVVHERRDDEAVANT